MEKFLAQGHRIPNPRLIALEVIPHYPPFSVFLFPGRAKTFFPSVSDKLSKGDGTQ